MANATLGAVWQRVERLALSDGDLLAHFAATREEGAFAALMRRHGPMVLAVGRRVLRQAQDAEDVFQATFLVLARRAGSIRERESVGSWLHGVAHRLALKARNQGMARQARERRATDMKQAETTPGAAWRELQGILDEELQRLPPRFRSVLVACYLEGRTQEEAARELGCPIGTVRSRVARGRKLLHDRLTARGLVLSAAALAVALTAQVATAASASLSKETLKAALQFAAGGSMANATANAVALAEGGLKAASMARVKAGLALAMLLTMMVGGVGLLTQAAAQPQSPPPARPESPKPSEPRQARTDRYGDPLPDGAVVRLGTVHLRHEGEVSGLTFSPDGKLMASGALDNTARLWDAATGREVWRFRGEEAHSPVNAVAFSPDGRTLAIGCGDKTIRLVDVARRKEFRKITGPGGEVRCLAFSPDGKVLASGCGGWHWGCKEDTAVRLWDVESGKELGRLAGHPSGVRCVAFSPDGKTLASAGGSWEEEMRAGKQPDSLLRFWDVATGREIHTFGGHEGGVRAVAYSPDGRLVASGDGKVARLWDAASGKELMKLTAEKDQKVESVAFAADGRTLVSSGLDGKVRVWDVTTGKEVRQAEKGQNWPRCVAISPDGKTIASAGAEKRIRLWEAATGKEVPKVQEHQSGVWAVAFAPDGKTLVTSSIDTTLRLWDATTGEELRVFRGHEHYVEFVAFSPDGKHLASTGYMDESVRVWDVETGNQVHKLPGSREGRFFAVAFSPDGKTVAAGGEGGGVRRWEVATGKELAGFPTGDRGWPQSLAYSPDGTLLAMAGDKAIRLWDVASGKERTPIEVPDGPGHVAFSPDGKSLLTGGKDRVVRLWELASGGLRWAAEGHQEPIASVAFSLDGKAVLSGGSDRTVRLWDVGTGKPLHTLRGHDGTVRGVAMSPDGRRAASASEDNTALIWDVGEHLRREPVRAEKLSAQDLDDSWACLAGGDAAKAYSAIRTLSANAEQAVPYLKTKLLSKPTADKLTRSVADLDSDDFAVRQRATRELTDAGDAAESALRRALAASPSAEVRGRVEQLLDKLESSAASPGRLLGLRAIEALELIGTTEAKQVLEGVAASAPEARTGREAKAALARLARSVMTAP